jgi:hypothetical protein
MADNLDHKSPAQSDHVSYSRNQSPLQSIASLIKKIFSNRTTAIAAVLLLLIGIGATIIAVQNSTEYRQRASEQTADVGIAQTAEITMGGSTQKSATTVASTLEWPHNVTEGDNRFLLVSITVRAPTISGTPPNVTSVTYDGVPLSPGASGNSTSRNTSVWTLRHPTVGPEKNVKITMSGPGIITAGATTLFGVSQLSSHKWLGFPYTPPPHTYVMSGTVDVGKKFVDFFIHDGQCDLTKGTAVQQQLYSSRSPISMASSFGVVNREDYRPTWNVSNCIDSSWPTEPRILVVLLTQATYVPTLTPTGTGGVGGGATPTTDPGSAGNRPLVCGGYGDLNSDGRITTVDVQLAQPLLTTTPDDSNFTDGIRRRKAHVSWDGSDSTERNVNQTDINILQTYVNQGVSSFSCKNVKHLPVITQNIGCLWGDVDNDKRITYLDAFIILSTEAGLQTGIPNVPKVGDVDNNGDLSGADELMVKSFARGTRNNFTKTCTQKPLVCGAIGDVDGDGVISTNDSWEILHHDTGLSPLYNYINANANTDGNSTFGDPIDALQIDRYLGNLSPTLPACLLITQAPTAAPTGTGGTCTPAQTVQFDNSSSAIMNTPNTDLRWTHTVLNNQPNRILIVGVNPQGGGITGVKLENSQVPSANSSFTKIASNLPGEMYYFKNPPVGASTIFVDVFNAQTVGAGVTSWYNVNQSTPFTSAVAKQANSTSDPNVQGTGVACGVIVDSVGTNSSTCTANPASGQTQRYVATHGPSTATGSWTGTAGGSSKPGSTSFEMRWNLTSGGSACAANWTIKAISLIPAGASVTIPPTSTSTPTTTTTPVTPICNSGPVDCTVCTAPTNTCSGSGTQQCRFTTHTSGGTCIPEVAPRTCTGAAPNCIAPKVCSNGTCVAPTVTPTLTSAPTGIPTGVTNKPTTTSAPSVTSAPGDTILALTVGLDGIGNTGDNALRTDTSAGNKNPIESHRSKAVAVVLFDQNGVKVSGHIGTINYDEASDLYKGNINLGNKSGTFIIKITTAGYLTRQLGGFVSLQSGQTHTVNHTIAGGPNLIAGDVNSDNALNIKDYNIINACVFNRNPSVCGDFAATADYTANGTVDHFDYNLFLRELSVQNGD